MKSRIRCAPLGALLIVLFATNGFSAEDEKEFIAFSIKHVDVSTVYSIAETMLSDHDGVRLSFDTRSNTIYIQGPIDAISLLKSLVEKIDIQRAEDKTIIRMFALQHVPADNMVGVLREILGLDSNEDMIRISADRKLNMLIVSAPDEALQRVGEIVERMDQSQEAESAKSKNNAVENCIVRVTWLVDAENEDLKPYRVPNPDLSELVAGLKTEGIMKFPAALTEMQSSVKVAPVDQDSCTSFTVASNRFMNGRTYSGNAKGSLKRTADGKYDLEIALQIQNGAVPIEVGTRISLPKSHPVAFSVSDLGDMKTAAVVEIIEVKSGK